MKKLFSLLMFVAAFFCFAFMNENSFNPVLSRAEAAIRQVQAAHILVPTEDEAVKIREEVMTGNPDETFNRFMEAAKKYSKCPSGKSGGILGWFSRGDMVPEFENAAFNLPSGVVSEPVKTQFGWHLIYVISKK